MALEHTKDVATEVAYYAGLKAQSEGRGREASDWFRIVVHLRREHEGEYGWAYAQLYRLTDRASYLSN